jgi:hypothetical protein
MMVPPDGSCRYEAVERCGGAFGSVGMRTRASSVTVIRGPVTKFANSCCEYAVEI